AIIRRLSEYYSKVLEVHNMRREHPTKFVFTEFTDLEESINELRANNPMQWTALLAEYLKMLMLKIKEIENTMINMEAAPK
ncbi:MAG TPA: hypothetical protein VEC16_00160, partial [Alphaproteobacteria bacterium]|nr:hypothetical protein [Alphaproteobacteria bacterium]